MSACCHARACALATLVLLLMPLTGAPPAAAQGSRLLELTDKLDRMDLGHHLDEAERCSARRQIACANDALTKAGKVAQTPADRQRVSDAVQRLNREIELINEERRQAELERQLEEERERAREEERRRVARREAERAAEQREKNTARRERERAERERRDAAERDRDRKLFEDNERRLQAHQQRVREMQAASAERQRQQAAADRQRWEQQQRDQRARAQADERAREAERTQRERSEADRRAREEREREQERLAEERRRAEEERRAEAERQRQERLAQDKADRERQQREREEQARAKREADEREKADALDALRGGTRLAARRCSGGEGRYFIVGSVPQGAKNKVGCIDVGWSAHCPGDNSGIRGTARNFVGAASDCYMGDTVPIQPTPACPVEQVRVEVRDVRACGR